MLILLISGESSFFPLNLSSFNVFYIRVGGKSLKLNKTDELFLHNVAFIVEVHFSKNWIMMYISLK